VVIEGCISSHLVLSRWLLLFLQDFEDEQFKKFEISLRKRDVRASLADREDLLLVTGCGRGEPLNQRLETWVVSERIPQRV
jgi:hypothetical protein